MSNDHLPVASRSTRVAALVAVTGALLTLLLLVTTVWLAPAAHAEPPGIPTAATARTQLSNLPTRADGSTSGYSRSLFPHWTTVSGTCDAREQVLKRDGTGVRVGADCQPTAGSWFSPYDGVTRTTSSSVDIDHVVPLAAAWRSGASSWTTARRQAFANDLSGPALIAVTDSVNRSKGDQTPATWKPPRTAYHCTYARMWIGTKAKWGLSANSAEKAALSDMLNRC